MYILTNCIVFSKLKLTDFLLDQFLYLFLYVYKLCQLVAYVLAVAPIIWVSRSIAIYSKLLLSHFILFRNKHILIPILILIQIRSTKRASMFPVGNIESTGVSAPIVVGGVIVDILDPFKRKSYTLKKCVET